MNKSGGGGKNGISESRGDMSPLSLVDVTPLILLAYEINVTVFKECSLYVICKKDKQSPSSKQIFHIIKSSHFIQCCILVLFSSKERETGKRKNRSGALKHSILGFTYIHMYSSCVML